MLERPLSHYWTSPLNRVIWCTPEVKFLGNLPKKYLKCWLWYTESRILARIFARRFVRNAVGAWCTMMIVEYCTCRFHHVLYMGCVAHVLYMGCVAHVLNIWAVWVSVLRSTRWRLERQSHTTVIHTAGVDSGVRPSLYLVELAKHEKRSQKLCGRLQSFGRQTVWVKYRNLRNAWADNTRAKYW